MRQYKGALLALAVATVMTGCKPSSQTGAGQPGSRPMAEVGVMTVKTSPLTLTSQLPGRVHAYQQAEIRPQVSGIILKRLFVEGSKVSKGQPLYQIDPAPFDAKVASADASLSRAKASAHSAELKLKRYQKLAKTQYVSQQDLDDAQAAYDLAKADVQVAKAALHNAKIDLGYTTVTSPISGQIGKSNVTAGALVTANQSQALALVQTLSPIYVDLSESSAALLAQKNQIAKGQLQATHNAAVTLTLSDHSTYPQKGDLEFTEVNVDPQTGSVTLRARFANPDSTLLPGMFVRANVDTGNAPDAILVPQKAVRRNPRGEAEVMLVKADGTVAIQPVETAESVGNQWHIVSGLKAGDRVILDGLQKARPGTKVKTVAASDSQ